MKPFLNYPGGKDGHGTLQNIINLIPELDHYFELFLGGGAIFRGLETAKKTTLNDIDPAVYHAWHEVKDHYQPFNLYNLNAIDCIIAKDIAGHKLDLPGNFIFLDLPYRFIVPKNQQPIYNYELNDLEHRVCLDALTTYKFAKIMICHYPDHLYNELLSGWHTHDYKSMTRAGMANERLYMNYAKPERLHDYRYIGCDFTYRQQLKRMRVNIINKLSRLDPVLRNAMLSDITKHFSTMQDLIDQT